MKTISTDTITYTLTNGTTSDPEGFVINRTWNNGGVAFTGLVVNATDSASSGTSKIADFKLNGTSKASINKDGSLTANGGNSDQWNSTYTTVQANSSNWNPVFEYYELMVRIATAGSTVNTNNVVKNISSFVLPAGDWDVQGTFGLQPNGAASITGNIGGIGTTSATFDLGWEVYGSPSSLVTSGTIPARRFSFTVPTTVYLYSRIDFTSGSPRTFGWMTARRVR